MAVTIPTSPAEAVLLPQQPRTPVTGDFISDDDRSIAAVSSSIKTITFDNQHGHAAAAVNLHPSSDYSWDKDDEEDGEDMTFLQGLQRYWDAIYAEELLSFREHGLAGEIWFGPEVMDTVVSWTKSLCADILRRQLLNHVNGNKVGQIDHEAHAHNLSSWSVLDLGTGNGLLLHELAKHGFANLTGVDYSEGAIYLARGLADRDGFGAIDFLVDDVLDTKLETQFQLVMDKGTLDVIGSHPKGLMKRQMYWHSLSKLVAPGGVLVITSCNSTKDELAREVEDFNRRSVADFVNQGHHSSSDQEFLTSPPAFEYIDHVRSYPTFMFGGVVGSHLATVAFMRN